MSHYKQELYSFFSNPENFLYALDVQRGAFEFVPAKRDFISGLGFLDHRGFGQIKGKKSVSVQDGHQTLAQTGFINKPPRINLIFHSGYCCSTMIARCLDFPGRNLSLKEPMAMLSLGVFKRALPGFESINQNWKTLRDLTLFLQTRPFREGEEALIKASNGANNIAAEIAESPMVRKTLLIYSELETFLVSVLNGGQTRAGLVEEMLQVFSLDFADFLPIPQDDVFRLSSLQRAALVWGLEMRHFETILRNAKNGKIRSLDCETFLASPGPILKAIGQWFNLATTDEERAAILRSPLFTAHSKDLSVDYSKAARVRDREKIMTIFDSDIKAAKTWLDDLGFDVAPELPNPVQ